MTEVEQAWAGKRRRALTNTHTHKWRNLRVTDYFLSRLFCIFFSDCVCVSVLSSTHSRAKVIVSKWGGWWMVDVWAVKRMNAMTHGPWNLFMKVKETKDLWGSRSWCFCLTESRHEVYVDHVFSLQSLTSLAKNSSPTCLSPVLLHPPTPTPCQGMLPQCRRRGIPLLLPCPAVAPVQGNPWMWNAPSATRSTTATTNAPGCWSVSTFFALSASRGSSSAPLTPTAHKPFLALSAAIWPHWKPGMPSPYPATPASCPGCPPGPSTCPWLWPRGWLQSPREWCSPWRATATGTPASSSYPPSACGCSRCTPKPLMAQRLAWWAKRRSYSRAGRHCFVYRSWLSSSGCCLWSLVCSGWCLGHISWTGNFRVTEIVCQSFSINMLF